MLKGDQLPLDFKEGFGVIFKHGTARADVNLECSRMRYFYAFLYRKTEAEQRKFLFGAFSAPQNTGLLAEHARELSGRVIAYNQGLKEAARAANAAVDDDEEHSQ